MKHSERKKQITHKWKTIRIITDIVLDGSQKIMKYIQSMIQNNQQQHLTGAALYMLVFRTSMESIEFSRGRIDPVTLGSTRNRKAGQLSAVY